MFDQSSDIIKVMAGILRGKLYCDDFRMLPDTTSIWPIFQLMIRFPSLKEKKYHDLVASLTLGLILSSKSQSDLLKLNGYDQQKPKSKRLY